MEPQKSEPPSLVAENGHRLVPKRTRFRVRALGSATADSRGIRETLMGHHRVVPFRKPHGERQRFRRTDGISNRSIHVHRIHSSGFKKGPRGGICRPRSRRPTEDDCAPMRAPIGNLGFQPLLP
jgi:hypothetical protein